jgi:hypothetical protein
MNRKDELSSMMEALHVLNIARNKLVYDFNNKKPEVYLPMYKYENHPELMNLALENYFTSWVNFHFIAWSKHYPDKSGKLFYQVIRDLLLKHSDVSGVDPRNHSFIAELISSKIQLIDGLIRSGERDNEKYSALLLEYEKDKALFEREINRLKGNS